MLTRPPWTNFSDRGRLSIRYIWDDTRALKDFTGDAAPVLRAAMMMSLRARMVLCMGLYEWSLWRFEGLHVRAEPLQIAEAGWCATVDPRYLKFFELTRDDWRGPIEGPLWCAAMWLQPAMSQGHLFPRAVYDAISFLTRLALHVLPEVDQFHAWLMVVLDRLIQVCPLAPADPLEDVFDRRVAQRLGIFIGRNVLDPASKFEPHLGVSFLARTLRDARDADNPFLASPGDLREAGFTAEPYVLAV